MNLEAQNTTFIKNGAIKLSIKVYSKDNPETIILLHGGPGVPDDMLEIVNQLKVKYRVITFEQRGVGLSECKRCGFKMEDYIADLDAISKRFELDSFHLFGHSWGGLYAQIYAAARPENIRSLFLCSPSSGTNKTWKKTEKEVMQFNKDNSSTKEWLKMGWNSLLGMLGHDKAYRKLFKQVLKNYHKNYVEVETTDEFLNKIFSRPINKTRKEILKYKSLKDINSAHYPIGITYGEFDVYGDSKNKLIKRYPTAKIEVIEKCGHIPWKHNPKEFTRILAAFYLKKA